MHVLRLAPCLIACACVCARDLQVGQTCLHVAASNGHVGVAKLLIQMGGRDLLFKREEVLKLTLDHRL